MNSGQKMCDSKGDLSKITLADRLKMKEILTATIASLCKNSLGFDFELTIEGLLGITVDKTDVLLISIREVSLFAILYIFSDLRILTIEGGELTN